MKKFAVFFIKAVIAISLPVLVILMLVRGCSCKHKEEPESIRIVYDTVHYYDTINVKVNTPVDSTVIKYITVKLPAADADNSKNSISVDSSALYKDSSEVCVPITQKEYQDSLYHIWISGYMPSLDSAHIRSPTRVIYHTEWKYKKKRWGIGLQAGYGVSSRFQHGPYLGIGIQYNIFSW